MKKSGGDQYEFSAIGIIESCFKQKFAIPRQSGLVPQAQAKLILNPQYNHLEVVRGLEQYSHLWILFVFHQSLSNKRKLTVRPPRLGGKEKLGVFATRSNFRPNPIGQSVVKLDSIENQNNNIILNLSGVDILHNSPVIDIKPYLPYSDCVANAKAGIAHLPPEKEFSVTFSEIASKQLEDATARHGTDIAAFISELLAYDPRPAFYDEDSDTGVYASKILDFDLKWQITDKKVTVLELKVFN